MLATLLAALAEAVGGLFGGLGQAIFPRLVAGVALVGHDPLFEPVRGGSVLGLRNVSRARRSARVEQKDQVTVAASLETRAGPRG